ncbi:hypothetical protein OUZ56_008595 [Daphnia magna]|uniref:Uncharacterized protein n=1 Tax=Daphnia magna TaxID=35525 RepID=A0ABR0ADG3_9CRUS|nr:hypothetical protein OUZ56_008595 [Daphnia magna]
MVFASLFSLLPSWTKARTEPKIGKSFPSQDPDIIQLTDEEFNTNQADQISKNSSFLQCENERMPTPRTASQLYLEAVTHGHHLRAVNNQQIPRTSIQSKPASDSRNQPARKNGLPNSVMSQETQSPGFVNRLQLLEQRIAELEWRGSFMPQDLKKHTI